jgi:predicted ribosomally synthesized peptide with SipW-like signal peptide
MKTIILSVVVVGALVAAGIGGTLADFSDIELSPDNKFQTGSMDLTISDADGNEYNGANIPAVVAVSTGWPDCSKDRTWDVHNIGESEQEAPWLYIHFKNVDCSFVDTKQAYGYMEFETPTHLVRTSDNTQIAINEPQDVAIFGGLAGENSTGGMVFVPGIGDKAICLLSRLVTVQSLMYSDAYDSANPLRANWAAVIAAGEQHSVNLTRFEDNGIPGIQIDELDCNQIYLFQLPGCKMRWMHMSLIFENLCEDSNYVGLNCFEEGSKFENWPTNAVMNQKLEWDMAFELFGQATKPFPGD